MALTAKSKKQVENKIQGALNKALSDLTIEFEFGGNISPAINFDSPTAANTDVAQPASPNKAIQNFGKKAPAPSNTNQEPQAPQPTSQPQTAAQPETPPEDMLEDVDEAPEEAPENVPGQAAQSAPPTAGTPAAPAASQSPVAANDNQEAPAANKQAPGYDIGADEEKPPAWATDAPQDDEDDEAGAEPSAEEAEDILGDVDDAPPEPTDNVPGQKGKQAAPKEKKPPIPKPTEAPESAEPEEEDLGQEAKKDPLGFDTDPTEQDEEEEKSSPKKKDSNDGQPGAGISPRQKDQQQKTAFEDAKQQSRISNKNSGNLKGKKKKKKPKPKKDDSMQMRYIYAYWFMHDLSTIALLIPIVNLILVQTSVYPLFTLIGLAMLAFGHRDFGVFIITDILGVSKSEAGQKAGKKMGKKIAEQAAKQTAAAGAEAGGAAAATAGSGGTVWIVVMAVLVILTMLPVFVPLTWFFHGRFRKAGYPEAKSSIKSAATAGLSDKKK
jgi:hypothetical protein